MKLLLAIDGSAPSRAGLNEVAVRQWPSGTQVEVLHVIEPAHLWTTSSTAEELARRGADLITEAVSQLRAAGLNAQGELLHGDPKRVILDRAYQTRPDWVVVGAHSSAAERFLMGNVASAVLHYAPCSVEIVRAPLGSAPKILLATDGSPASECAARSVAERPWPAEAEVRVLSVVELTMPPMRAMLEPPFLHSSDLEEIRAAAMKRAEQAVQAASGIVSAACRKVSESISVLLEGPRKIVVDEADLWGANLIVLGSHGRHGVDRFLLGSVSQSVAMHAHCSVEVVRAR